MSRKLNRDHEAPAPGQEAAIIYRDLAETDPDLYRGRLASALHLSASPLRMLNRHHEALAPGVGSPGVGGPPAARHGDRWRKT